REDLAYGAQERDVLVAPVSLRRDRVEGEKADPFAERPERNAKPRSNAAGLQMGPLGSRRKGSNLRHVNATPALVAAQAPMGRERKRVVVPAKRRLKARALPEIAALDAGGIGTVHNDASAIDARVLRHARKSIPDPVVDAPMRQIDELRRGRDDH